MKKRFVMDIPAELHQRLRIVCVLEGKTMKQIAQKLLEDYVEKAEKRKLIVLPKVKHPKEAS
jgi:predicted DNA-binding protein